MNMHYRGVETPTADGTGIVPPRGPRHRAEDDTAHPTLFDRIELAHFLEGKGLIGSRLAHDIVPFSRAVAEAYVLKFGEYPRRVEVWIPDLNAHRRLYFYQGPADRQLIEDVFHSMFTLELEMREDAS